jgi:hypothetical protein
MKLQIQERLIFLLKSGVLFEIFFVQFDFNIPYFSNKGSFKVPK